MSKQQQRNQQKRAAKKEAKAAEEAAAVAGAGSRISASITAADLVQSGESLVLGSCIAHYAPKLPDLLKENGEDATQEKAKEPAEEKESAEAEAERSGAGSPSDAFAELTTRLAWSNPLGLARPLSGEDAIAQWKALSQLEVDGGPRKSKRGSWPTCRNFCRSTSTFCSCLGCSTPSCSGHILHVYLGWSCGRRCPSWSHWRPWSRCHKSL